MTAEYPKDDERLAKEALLPQVDAALVVAKTFLDAASREYVEELVFAVLPTMARTIFRDHVLFHAWKVKLLQDIRTNLALAPYDYSPELGLRFLIVTDENARQTPSFKAYQLDVLARLDKRDGDEALAALPCLTEPGCEPTGDSLHAWREMTKEGKDAALERYGILANPRYRALDDRDLDIASGEALDIIARKQGVTRHEVAGVVEPDDMLRNRLWTRSRPST